MALNGHNPACLIVCRAVSPKLHLQRLHTMDTPGGDTWMRLPGRNLWREPPLFRTIVPDFHGQNTRF
jgi:hypothetical protein